MKKQKSLLTRPQTRTLLTAIKVSTVAGVLSLTMAGWGLMAKADTTNVVPSTVASSSKSLTRTVNVTNRSVVAAPTATAVPQSLAAAPAPTATPATVTKLNIVQWVNDNSGNRIAVVQDSGGNLWLVMGTDVPRIEQGLNPEFQPQLWRQFGFSRGS